MTRKTLLFGLSGLIALLQFFPMDHRLPPTRVEDELQVINRPPDQVMRLLNQGCYDCHSTHTRYPWYTWVQPVAWWIQDHIEKGRAELNFSEFGQWSAEDRKKALAHCAKLIAKGTIPLRSYQILHPEARFSAEEKRLLINWLSNPDPLSAGQMGRTDPADACNSKCRVLRSGGNGLLQAPKHGKGIWRGGGNSPINPNICGRRR